MALSSWKIRISILALIGMGYAAPVLEAHPLAPALLEITETSAREATVLWKTPLSRAPEAPLRPLLPESCQRLGAAERRHQDKALVETWRVSCSQAWVGSQVTVQGFSSGQANAILRITLADGLVHQAVLNADSPSFTLPPRAQGSVVFADYFRLGLEHILSGWDHLLFVLGLLLLVKNPRQLLAVVTCFTLGHSLTLSAAVLGWVRLPPRPIEALIALSILFLAIELTRRQRGRGTFFHRFPWSLTFAFGLLHGLGFAGALSELGLPAGEIPMALFAFNVGIEAGQLLFIFVILGLWALFRRMPLPRCLQRIEAPAYLIGSLAAFWLMERIAGL